MKLPSLSGVSPQFDGSANDPALDHVLLSKQLGRVFESMRDGGWRTSQRIAYVAGDQRASVSARPRQLQKPRFGGCLPQYGLCKYHLLVRNTEATG